MHGSIIEPVKNLIHSLLREEFLIDEDRQTILSDISKIIREELKANSNVKLMVICTHNSRRSQTAEVWFRVAARYYNIPNLEAFSGGTEMTAFNPRMIQAFSRAGFFINLVESGDNSKYQIQCAVPGSDQVLFSKKYNDEFNPQEGFIAMLVCDQADESCPIVHGAEHRFFVQYADPKKYDNQLNEQVQYDLTVREIGREILFLMKRVSEANDPTS